MFDYQPEVGSHDLHIYHHIITSQVIQNIQNMLVPEAANIVFMSPRVSGECSSQEPWFGTNYCVEGNQ